MECLLKKVIELEKYWLIDEKKEDGFSALHLACLNNYYDVVKLMLNYSQFINLNIQNTNLQTPLHLTIERLNYDISKLLIECQINSVKQCNINLQDKDGDTSLHCLLRNYTICQLKNQKDTAQENNNVIENFLKKNI